MFTFLWRMPLIGFPDKPYKNNNMAKPVFRHSCLCYTTEVLVQYYTEIFKDIFDNSKHHITTVGANIILYATGSFTS